MEHLITHKNIDISINFDRGLNQRYLDIPIVSNNFKRIYHKGHVIDAQLERFEIICYSIIVDSNGIQIPNTQSTAFRIPIEDESYDQLYSIVSSSMPAIKEMNLRAVNGIIENEYGKGFVPYDPINNLVPIQPVEFELSQSENSIQVDHTDGSGVYEYSLDNGATWDNASILSDLSLSQEYEVSVRDNSSNWFRTKKITLV